MLKVSIFLVLPFDINMFVFSSDHENNIRKIIEF
jgi:hypothetical protein